MPDPASVLVTVTAQGLSAAEAGALLANTPANGQFHAEVSQPAIGPRRYSCTVDAISVVGGVDVLDALRRHLEAIQAQHDAADAPREDR